MKKNNTLYNLCLASVFTALTAALAQVSIPLPYGVPITLQTFAILLAGAALGAKWGAASAGVYVLLGAMGAPVFAGFRGSAAVLAGPTGGFILSFPLMAFIAGMGKKKSLRWLWLALGVSVNYGCGMIHFSFIMGVGLEQALMACVLPFIPGDALKVAAVAVVANKKPTGIG